MLGMTCFFILNAACHAQPVLRFQSEITDKASRLGDLLIIEQDEYHWSDLSLDSHPISGNTITKTAILDWMMQRLGHFDSTWLGKTEALIKKSTQSSEKMLVETARAALIEKLKTRYSRVDVTPLSHPKDRNYALDTFNIDVHLTYPTTKRVCVWLTHGERTRIPVWFNVKAYARVFVANRNLRYNTAIQDHAFSLKERNIAGLNAAPVKSLSQPAWLKTSLPRHSVLLKTQLKEAPMVVKGQRINVTTHNHGITIAMDAIAMANGYSGDSITVKNSLNQKTFVAKISGFQQAEMTL